MESSIADIPAWTAALPHSPPVGERRTTTCICGTVRRRDRRDRLKVSDRHSGKVKVRVSTHAFQLLYYYVGDSKVRVVTFTHNPPSAAACSRHRATPPSPALLLFRSSKVPTQRGGGCLPESHIAIRKPMREGAGRGSNGEYVPSFQCSASSARVATR